MKKPTGRAITALCCIVLLLVCIASLNQSSESSILQDNGINKFQIDDTNSADDQDIHSSIHNDDTLRAFEKIVQVQEARIYDDMQTLEMKEENGPSMDRYVQLDNREQENRDNETIQANEQEPEMKQDDSFVSNIWKPEWSTIFSLF